jgi:hypothetical protein
MMRPIRVLIAMSLLFVSACATQVPPPPPAVAASVPISQRMPMPMPVGTYVGMPVPALMPGGDYATPNVGLSSAGAIWHLRSGLNFAALACRGPEAAVIVARYNALLAAQKPVFAGAEVAVLAEYRAQAGVEWRDAYDDAMTRLYNYYSFAGARTALCAAAERMLGEAQAVPQASFADFAATHLPELDRGFTDVFRAYEAWRDQHPLVSFPSYGITYAANAATPQTGLNGAAPKKPWIAVDPVVLRLP